MLSDAGFTVPLRNRPNWAQLSASYADDDCVHERDGGEAAHAAAIPPRLEAHRRGADHPDRRADGTAPGAPRTRRERSGAGAEPREAGAGAVGALARADRSAPPRRLTAGPAPARGS